MAFLAYGFLKTKGMNNNPVPTPEETEAEAIAELAKMTVGALDEVDTSLKDPNNKVEETVKNQVGKELEQLQIKSLKNLWMTLLAQNRAKKNVL